MSDFLTLFEALIKSRWENREGFCAASGMTSAYMSVIFGPKKKLPAVAGMAQYLEKAGVPKETSDQILYALAMEKGKQDPNYSDLIRLAEQREGERREIMLLILRATQEAGIKIPPDLIARVNAL